MADKYKYNNIFSPEGKLLQVEYSLESINSSLPFVIAKSKDLIICAAKKKTIDKLLDDEERAVHRINENTYAAITGIPADVDQVAYKVKDLSATKEYSLGFIPTADIICRSFADKTQKLIQKNSTRPFAFSMTVFGFEYGRSMIYCTDASGIFYPFFATGVGENSSKVNKYLESGYREDLNESQLFELVLEGISESIGPDFSPADVEVCFLKCEESLKYLSYEEIDAILLRVSEKD